jgi:hypothetical protein
MARKLKTYVTSVGFFDLAIAAPSMKAALEAWGSNTNLFHQGFAREINEASVVEATLAKPGVVLRRAVGSNKPFEEEASLPTNLAGDPIRTSKRRERKERSPREIDQKAAREAALAYEKWRRDAEHRQEEAAREKARQRRERAVEKIQAALDKAEREHTRRVDVIETERADVEARAQAEDARWHKRKSELEKALRRARS